MYTDTLVLVNPIVPVRISGPDPRAQHVQLPISRPIYHYIYIHTYIFISIKIIIKKKREGGLEEEKISGTIGLTKTIMTQTQATNADIVKITQKRYHMHI